MSQMKKVKTPMTKKTCDKSNPISTVTKKNVNSSGSKLITPVAQKAIQKKRGASTPTDDKKNSSVASFGDISNISINNQKNCNSTTDNEFLYSEYLRKMFLESLVDKNLEDKALCIDNEIINLNKRLDQSTLLLEESERSIKELNFLCDQSTSLHVQNETITEALSEEAKIKESTHLETLRKTLQCSSNNMPTRNIACEINLPHISIDAVNKLNDVLCNLRVGLKEIGTSYKTSLKETHDLKENLEKSKTVLEDLVEVHDSVENHQELLDEHVIKERSLKFMQ